MKPSLPETLCTRCGLCCDGSLFADVELSRRDEASAMEVMGLEIEDADEGDGSLLLQPCRALKAKRCGIYPYRPDCCRTFECCLLQEVKRGDVSVDRARAKIAETLLRIERIRELVRELGLGSPCLPLKELCSEALADTEEALPNPESDRKRAELKAAMGSLERLIRAMFLGGPM